MDGREQAEAHTQSPHTFLVDTHGLMRVGGVLRTEYGVHSAYYIANGIFRPYGTRGRPTRKKTEMCVKYCCTCGLCQVTSLTCQPATWESFL